MAFVKLDCGILDSTLWLNREARECFITALLMAHPCEFEEPVAQIEVRTLKETGFVAPPGWYGFVPAAGVAIVLRAGIKDEDAGMAALERLGSPEQESRSPEFEGRRMIRINGGYLILNFMKYRDRDHTGAERAKRYRDRQKASHRDDTQSRCDNPVTSRMQSAECRDQKQRLDTGTKNPEPAPSAPAKDAKGRPKSKRLPADFDLNPLRAWAQENCPGVNFEFEIAQLRDHQFRDAHSDWPAVIRKWMRAEFKKLRQHNVRPGAKPPMTHAEAMDALNRLPPPPDEL